MVAGGSGITPVYQYIRHMLEEKSVYEISVLFANKTEGDILMREILEELATQKRIKLSFVLDVGHEGWNGHVGFVNDKMFEDSFDKPGEDHLMLVCGPPFMVRDVKAIANRLGFEERNMAVF